MALLDPIEALPCVQRIGTLDGECLPQVSKVGRYGWHSKDWSSFRVPQLRLARVLYFFASRPT